MHDNDFIVNNLHMHMLVIIHHNVMIWSSGEKTGDMIYAWPLQ